MFQSAMTAKAAIDVKITNNTNQIIAWLELTTDTGSTSLTEVIIPGNYMILGDGNATKITGLNIDTGVTMYQFKDLSTNLGVDGAAINVSFNLNEAGAQIVLDDNLKIIEGTCQPLGNASAVPFDKVFSSPKAMDMLALGASPSHRSEGDLFLPVSFANEIWSAFISLNNSGDYFFMPYEERPAEVISLYTVLEDENAYAETDKAIVAMGYRPWYAYVTEGQQKDVIATVRVWDELEGATPSMLSELVVELCSSVYEGIGATIQIFYIPEVMWDKAVAGEQREIPVFILQTSSSDSVIVNYLSDGSYFVDESRHN